MLKRVESYIQDEKEIILPSKVILLTAGIDVQDDRLEIEITGWGLDEESWIINYIILTGPPVLKGIWNELDQHLQKRFKHPLGVHLGITAAGIDTGGHYTDMAYNFVRGKEVRRVYGMKGSSIPGKPIAPKKPSYNNRGKIPLYFIGTGAAKEIIYSRLKIMEPGPGYMHFDSKFCDDNYFDQLTSNKKVKRKTGLEYELIPGHRDEALDCKVYSYAALKIYNRDLRLIDKRVKEIAESLKNPEANKPKIKMRKSFATRLTGCPIHGTKFLVNDGGSVYCHAKIPRDSFGLTICYYHIKIKTGRKKVLICSNCKKRPAYKPGSLCKNCRNEKQKKYYKNKKG